MSQTPEPRIIVALDLPEPGQALELADRLDPALCRLKVGKELFTRAGPTLVEQLIRKDFGIFLDLKFHDIPNTVASACRVAAELGVWMVDVHALGGRRMLEAAREALEQSREPRPKLVGVTVLTSLERQDLQEVGIMAAPEAEVLRLARLVHEAGLDGVVCSAQEAAPLRKTQGQDFLLVTPGIRPSGSASDDQRRVVTPKDARAMGADYLVVGRPITRAPDPLAALQAICKEL